MRFDRTVHVLPDGKLLFDGKSGDSPATWHYDEPMVKLAASTRAAKAPDQPGMSYRDLKITDFGKHQAQGFAQYSKQLLDQHSTRRTGRCSALPGMGLVARKTGIP